MIFYPGATFITEFTLSDAEGAAVDADTTPTVMAARNGVDDATWLFTVTNVALSRYRVSTTIPLVYLPGDILTIVGTALVGGVTATAVIDEFILGTPPVGSAPVETPTETPTLTPAEAIAAAIASPARVRGDAGEVEARSLPDLIAAANYLASVDAATKGRRGLRITRLIPDGTVHSD